MGSLLRKLLPTLTNEPINSQDIYIVSVVSCYDRKLVTLRFRCYFKEASRRDFMDPAGIHDIDCVLATQEIAELLEKPAPSASHRVGWDETRWEAMESGCRTAFDDVLMSSGGVLQSLLKFELLARPAARLVFDLFVENSMKRTRTVRNSDFVESSVCVGEETVFRGAFIYGFRNIQNLTMKIKVELGM